MEMGKTSRAKARRAIPPRPKGRGIPRKMMKTLGNTDVNGARKNVKDIVVFGNGDLFKL